MRKALENDFDRGPAALWLRRKSGGCSASGTGNAEAGSSQDAAGNGSSQNAAAGDGRLQVAATIFPYYDFLRQIGGDRIGLQLVVPAGMDSHSFEPTPADMIAMQEADILVCNGGAMEQWVSQVLSSLDTGGWRCSP